MTARMPVLFLGYGSPMNAIEDNAWRRGWAEAAARLPRPKAVLCVSAHWGDAARRRCRRRNIPRPSMTSAAFRRRCSMSGIRRLAIRPRRRASATCWPPIRLCSTRAVA